MEIKRIVAGPLEVNTYLLVDGEQRRGAVIDPGTATRELLQAVADAQRDGVVFTHILLTHGHFDHVGGVEKVKQLTGAQVAIHSGDAPMLTEPQLNLSQGFGFSVRAVPADLLLEDGQTLTVGGTTLRVLHTPGHSPGGVCYVMNHHIFSGDTLFCRSVGRTDFPGSYAPDLRASLQKLRALEENAVVHPGHGPQTTLDEEKAENPYLGNGDNEAYL